MLCSRHNHLEQASLNREGETRSGAGTESVQSAWEGKSTSLLLEIISFGIFLTMLSEINSILMSYVYYVNSMAAKLW